VHAERGFRTSAEHIAKLAADNNFTRRQTVEFIPAPKPAPFAGSPATVAGQIEEWFTARALDGLNVGVGHPSQWRRFRAEVVPISAPEITRSGPAGTSVKNLGVIVPNNLSDAKKFSNGWGNVRFAAGASRLGGGLPRMRLQRPVSLLGRLGQLV
jgi:hypothetical protein